MPNVLAPPNIVKLMFFALTTNASAASDGALVENSYYLRAPYIVFLNGLTGSYVSPAYTSDVASTMGYYSSSYYPAYMWDTSTSTYWYLASAYNYDIPIPEEYSELWENPDYPTCIDNIWTLGNREFALDALYADAGSYFRLYCSSYGTTFPRNWVLMAEDENGKLYVLLDYSAEPFLVSDYTYYTLDVSVPAAGSGSECDIVVGGMNNTELGIMIACNFYYYLLPTVIQAFQNVAIDGAISGSENSDISACLKARKAIAYMRNACLRASIFRSSEVSSLVQSAFASQADLALTAKSQVNRGAVILGGEDFGMNYHIPLSSTVPLRLTCEWGKYKSIVPLPHIYGDFSTEPIPYLDTEDEYVIADHPILTVTEVYVNDEEIQGYEWRNGSDVTGRGVSFLTVPNLSSSDNVRVCGKGKLHPVTGNLLEGPGEVIWDFLYNIVKLDIKEYELSRFSMESYNEGLTVSGQIRDASKTIRAQIDELMLSVGGLWSGGMKGLAKVYPFARRN